MAGVLIRSSSFNGDSKKCTELAGARCDHCDAHHPEQPDGVKPYLLRQLSFESYSTLCRAPWNVSSTSNEKGDDGAAVELGSKDGDLTIRAEASAGQKRRILLSCCLQAFWVMGMNQSFGIFQRHYGSDKAVEDGIIQAQDQMQRAAIAAIQALGNGGIVALFGLLFFPRLAMIRGKQIKLLCFGSATLSTLGFATAAACSSLLGLLFTQGLLVGLGNGVFFHVLSTVLPEYFGKHVGLAQGTAVGCGGAGGLALSIVVPVLLEKIGSRRTLGVLSILSMCILGAASCLAQPPRRCERRKTTPIGWATFKDPLFTLLFLVNFIQPLTVGIPSTFSPDFSESLGFSDKSASYILAASSAVSIPSRFLIGFGADKIGQNNALILCTLLLALGPLTLWLPAAYTGGQVAWIVYSTVYGFAFGAFNTLINSVQRGHFGDELYYSYNGAFVSMRGLGYLTGVPVAGALVTRVKDIKLHGEDFMGAIVYTSVWLMVSTFCLAGVRLLDARKNGWKWVK